MTERPLEHVVSPADGVGANAVQLASHVPGSGPVDSGPILRLHEGGA
jgi:hypothetical protein